MLHAAPARPSPSRMSPVSGSAREAAPAARPVLALPALDGPLECDPALAGGDATGAAGDLAVAMEAARDRAFRARRDALAPGLPEALRHATGLTDEQVRILARENEPTVGQVRRMREAVPGLRAELDAYVRENFHAPAEPSTPVLRAMRARAGEDGTVLRRGGMTLVRMDGRWQPVPLDQIDRLHHLLCEVNAFVAGFSKVLLTMPVAGTQGLIGAFRLIRGPAVFVMKFIDERVDSETYHHLVDFVDFVDLAAGAADGTSGAIDARGWRKALLAVGTSATAAGRGLGLAVHADRTGELRDLGRIAEALKLLGLGLKTAS